jgi:hypothetical protein
MLPPGQGVNCVSASASKKRPLHGVARMAALRLCDQTRQRQDRVDFVGFVAITATLLRKTRRHN